ncbi:MAG TPA: ribonuclease D [Steroidobacteraceae bacterium]|nr:ribonuclease D [Steroidobacteraceae bacterium]
MREAMLIHDPGALETALFRLRGAERLALDTEFMRERTYHPQLCLVQIATETDCLLIDPLAGLDLAPLHELLQDRRKLKILHAARQDLEVLRLAGGAVPGPLFDTQVAAALLGFPAQVGYAELVARQLGHSIDKGQTRTDWSRRPLSAAQLAYAADDVRHLLVLHEELGAALAARGRAGWVEEETATYEDPALYRTDPATAWKRLKGLNRLGPYEQATARALAEWRERRAIESDKPRGWILTDEALYAIATRAPGSIQALEAIESLPAGVVRKRGEELLALVQAARSGTAPTPLEAPRKPSNEEQALASALLQVVRDAAATLEISAEVLGTRRDIEAIAFGSVSLEQSPLLRGWRGQVLREKLIAARPAAHLSR